MVSDPPEEEEQDEECEDVGVAYLRILDIMEKHTDMKDVRLNSMWGLIAITKLLSHHLRLEWCLFMFS